MAKEKQFSQYIFMFFISIIFSYFLIGNNFKAKFGIIDDHQIINILGPNLKINIKDLPILLHQDVFGTFGTFIRQVPTYLVLRTFEVFFWRNNPFLWYLFRFIILVLSIFTTWIILKRYLGKIYSFIFISYLMSQGYWSGILTRLGTHENYVMPGLILYCLGFFNIINPSKNKHVIFNWVSIFLGTVIAAGSKENLVILAIPTIFIFIYEIKQKNIKPISTILFILSTLFCIYVSVGVIIVLKNAGTDVYANNVGIGYRLLIFKDGFLKAIQTTRSLYFIVLTIIITFTAKYKKIKAIKSLIKTNIKYYLITIALVTIYASQYAFYNGIWPTGSRYDFPGLLVKPFYLLSIYFYVHTISNYFKIKLYFRHFFSFMFFGLILVLRTLTLQYKDLHEASLTNAVETNTFSNKIELITKITKNNPDLPIIFNSYLPFDYEPIASVNAFLTNKNVKNNKFLKLHYSQTSTFGSLEKELTRQLNSFSLDGGSDEFNFQPLSLYKDNTNCISITFYHETNDNCQFRETIP